jgi:hypothetical protein
MNINFIFDSFFQDQPECNIIPLKGYHSPETGYNAEFLLYRSIKELLTYNNDVSSNNNINFILYNDWYKNKMQYLKDQNLYFIHVRTDEFDSQWALNYIPKYIIEAANNGELKIIFSCMYIPAPIRDMVEWIERIKHKSKMIGLKNLSNLIFIWCDYKSTEFYQDKVRELFKTGTDNITDPLLKDRYNNFQQTGFPKIIDSNIWERAIIPSLKKFNPENKNFIPEYINNQKEKVFLYYNNSQKDHRFIMYKTLEMIDVLNKSFYSYRYGDNLKNYDLNKYGFLDKEQGDILKKYIFDHPIIEPKKLEDDNLFSSSSRINGKKNSWDLPLMAAYCSPKQITSSCFSLVTESAPHNHMSEKVYKLFYYGHPFIVLGGAGYLENLKKLGYKTFDFLFDESYDNLEYTPKKVLMIANEVKKYCGEGGIEKFMSHKTQLEDVLQHNREIFVTKDHSEFWKNI